MPTSISGLSVVGDLLKSDGRLVEVFQAHGGTDLLVSMSSCSRGPLKQHVAETLNAVSKGKKRKHVAFIGQISHPKPKYTMYVPIEHKSRKRM